MCWPAITLASGFGCSCHHGHSLHVEVHGSRSRPCFRGTLQCELRWKQVKSVCQQPLHSLRLMVGVGLKTDSGHHRSHTPSRSS